MDYKSFKKAEKFWKNKENEMLLNKIKECDDMLGVCQWLKENENKDAEGKPRYTASITLNIHGRGEDDANEKGVRSLSYDTNFDFVEKKVRGEYENLLKEFESKTKE